MVGQRNLHRGVDGLRTRVHEKDPIQVAGSQLGHPRGKLELLGMTAQEWRAEIELAQLPAHRVGDLLAAVSGRNAEEAGGRIDDLLAAIVPEVHAFRAHDHLGIVLEFAVRGERHPVLVERDLASSGLIMLSWVNV